MLFNSLEYALFLPIVFVIYWFVFVRSLWWQNLFLLSVSYLFYGWWDYRFLGLLVLTTALDYGLALGIFKASNQKLKNGLLAFSLVANLGILGFYKYYNFFVGSLVSGLEQAGIGINIETLDIILPVGISFYTFQTMSYTIDVYRGRLTPTNDFLGFAAFVAFFPQLVAGPIERASNLLPQILSTRKFNIESALTGIRLILWGLFKKVAIADALAPTVNEIFSNHESYPGGTLLLGAVFFAIQIYGDFSGYSDIARGTARLFGFELMSNFDFPYFSKSIGEFWRRWHISLSTWFRDYVYIPLGGSRAGNFKAIQNVFIVFLLSGFWHGANWTFIVWGLIHAFLFLPDFVVNRSKNGHGAPEIHGPVFSAVKGTLQTAITFLLVTIAWIFFRAESVEVASAMISEIFYSGFSFHPPLNAYDNQPLGIEYVLVLLFFIIEGLMYFKIINYPLSRLRVNLVVDAALTVALILFSPVSSDLAFIYFQF